MRIKKIVLLTLACLVTTVVFASDRKQRKTAVTECWKVDNSKGWNFTAPQFFINNMKQHPETLSDVASGFPGINSADMFDNSASVCEYLPEKMDSIDWALDVSKAEHELNEYSPIEKQYQTMSGTPFKYYLYDN